jgi:hypothetical protein
MSDNPKVANTVEASANVGGAKIERVQQSKLVEVMSPSVQNGVCWALCVDWLGNGGSMKFLGQSMWGRRKTNIEAQQRGGGEMNQQLSTMLFERGVKFTGKYRRGQKVQISLIYEFIVGAPALYFLGFWKSGGGGHAIAFRYSPDSVCVFDPNHGQFTFFKPGRLAQFRQFLEYLLRYEYRAYDKGMEIWRCDAEGIFSPNT